jgi:hypothetical protein
MGSRSALCMSLGITGAIDGAVESLSKRGGSSRICHLRIGFLQFNSHHSLDAFPINQLGLAAGSKCKHK